ncbi:MAG TPA: DUF1786 family protein [Ktedonobacterales bacterium]|nr:DUF1786 family protein [Ktedonobacterales bacterium]
MASETGKGARKRVLAVDVGTGTQDILLFESDRAIENCFQMVMPSPTVIVAERIHRATSAGRPVLLTGRTMGGGPCGWAARDHAQTGFACYATPDAARTLDDDLTMVEREGLIVIDDAEAIRIREREGARLVEIAMRDFDGGAIYTALTAFGVDPDVDAVAVAAFDHGAAPPGVSDRRFRFDAITERVRERPDALAFAYRAEDLPADLTRLAAVAADAVLYGDSDGDTPVFVMDTGAAALAGALEDLVVRGHEECLVANIGNFHTLAFHLRDGQILALFEHHTGLLDRAKLEGYLRELAAGTLTNERIFDDRGHGALTLDTHLPTDGATPFLAVTGPRRELLRGSSLAPYEATPHGAMMLAGCFGLLRAVAALDPDFAPAVTGVLGKA